MKHLLLAALLASTAHAGVLRFDVPCSDEKEVTTILTEYGETPMLVMQGVRAISGNVLNVSVTLYVNPNTKTYTIIEELRKDILCLVTTGEGLKVYKEEGEKEWHP